MCVISMVNDYGRQNWPIYPAPAPFAPPPDPNSKWTLETIEQFEKLVKAAERMDALMGEPDCVDPEKAKFMKELKKLKKRLKKLERKVDEMDDDV